MLSSELNWTGQMPGWCLLQVAGLLVGRNPHSCQSHRSPLCSLVISRGNLFTSHMALEKQGTVLSPFLPRELGKLGLPCVRASHQPAGSRPLSWDRCRSKPGVRLCCQCLAHKGPCLRSGRELVASPGLAWTRPQVQACHKEPSGSEMSGPGPPGPLLTTGLLPVPGPGSLWCLLL